MTRVIKVGVIGCGEIALPIWSWIALGMGRDMYLCYLPSPTPPLAKTWPLMAALIMAWWRLWDSATAWRRVRDSARPWRKVWDSATPWRKEVPSPRA